MSSSANHNYSTRARTWFLFFCSITAVGALGLGLVGGPPLTVEAYVVWRSSTTAAKTRGARRAAEPVASVVPVTGRERKQTREGTSAPRTAALSAMYHGGGLATFQYSIKLYENQPALVR